MPTYPLDALGNAEFERLAQSLVKAVVGVGSITFGPGPDGAREATFSGRAPYPSESEQWEGDWIFQSKFHDLQLLGADKARQTIIREVDEELDKIVNKYQHPCDNYILITNVPFSSVPGSGTHDRIAREAAARFPQVNHIHIWSYDDICRLLEIHGTVRQAYLHLLTPGDLIARLLRDSPALDLDRAVRLYLSTDFSNERYAQLDQAGDVGSDSLALARVFVDLEVVPQRGRKRQPGIQEFDWGEITDDEGRIPAMRLVLGEKIRKGVFIGGPGQGKSTLGQFAAQVHRAAILGRLPQAIGARADWTPIVVRIPFRVVLRDYAQWVGPRAVTRNGGAGDISVEAFLAERVTRLAAGHSLSAGDIQDIIVQSPTLLIFDGLDEVVDQRLRSTVVGEVGKFLDRASSGLQADMQVIGSSRPTGYAGEFGEADFVHLELCRLSTEKAEEYVDKWLAARSLDEPREMRVRENFKESSEDGQVQLLLTTPLQVSIIIYVILSGGRPSRQRESLFSDYVDVIYKRERAKHRSIIQTDRDVLIGLHEYLAYTLHRAAGEPTHVRSLLTEEEFALQVSKYLAYTNPFLTSDELRGETEVLVKEARDRLVLLVESSPGLFGFELRSLQEFFAASYLVGTASGSDERFARFSAIATSTHWRNVALFFAGRVGRLFKGEAPGIIEVARETDRNRIDRLLRRGAGLARGLAVDRAFGSAEGLQRSAIEDGLAVLESDPAAWSVYEVAEELRGLARQDIENHLIPAIEARLGALDVRRQIKGMQLLRSFAPASETMRELVATQLRRLSPADNVDVMRDLLVFRPDPADARRIVEGVMQGAGGSGLRQLLEYCMDDPAYLASVFADVAIGEDVASAVIDHLLTLSSRYVRRDAGHRHEVGPAPTDVNAGSAVQVAYLLRLLGMWRVVHGPRGRRASPSDVEDYAEATLGWLDAWYKPSEDRAVAALRALLAALVKLQTWREPVTGMAEMSESAKCAESALPPTAAVGALLAPDSMASFVWTAVRRDDGDAARAAQVVVGRFLQSDDGEARWYEAIAQLRAIVLRSADRYRAMFGLPPVDADHTLEAASRDLFGVGVSAMLPTLQLQFRRPTGDMPEDVLENALREVSERIRAGLVEEASEVMNPLYFVDSLGGGRASAPLRELLEVTLQYRLEREYGVRVLVVPVVELLLYGTVEDDDLERWLRAIGEQALPPYLGLRRFSPMTLSVVGRLAARSRSADGDGALRRGVATCIRYLLTFAEIGVEAARADLEGGVFASTADVEDMIDAPDPEVHRAGVETLAWLPGDEIASVILSRHDAFVERRGCKEPAWAYFARFAAAPTDASLQARVAECLAAQLSTGEARNRHAAINYLARVAEASEPEINRRNADLGLALRAS